MSPKAMRTYRAPTFTCADCGAKLGYWRGDVYVAPVQVGSDVCCALCAAKRKR